ncbi:MAG: hypothetical protein LBR90_04390 [Elusimicrobiota bacterium]|jgi:hypothetical protein|nr:hypothetical protein [Elusimicrobiota bacterium]
MNASTKINIILIVFLCVIIGFMADGTLLGKKPLAAATDAAKPASAGGAIAKYKQKANWQATQTAQEALQLESAQEQPAAAVPPPERLYKGGAIEFESGAAKTPQASFVKEKRGLWLAPPAGFNSEKTNNYLIYREEMQITPKLKNFLNEIHGNFVLDIIPFSVFSDFNRLNLMMFRTRGNYEHYTALPAWSGAAADVDNNAVYILENNHFKGNLVHELTHIYYDGFYRPSLSPLWLSEGMAVNMQYKAQDERQNAWIDDEQQTFAQGEYIKFDQFTGAKNLSGYSESDVQTWYAQARSVVDYLQQTRSKDEFYQFSRNLKEGMPVGRALYLAYGMPFNNITALEYAWQAELQRNKGARR